VSTHVPLELFADWLANGERGPSSDAMVHAFTGRSVGCRYTRPTDDYPCGPGSLHGCVRLLDQHPWARQFLGLVADLGPTWAALIDGWDELEQLLREETPTGMCPRTYARINQIIRETQR